MTYDFDFTSVLANWPQFLQGAWLTILLSFPATVIGFVCGTLLAIGRRGDQRWLAMACGAYVEVLRNTPLLVQVFLVFYGLASLFTWPKHQEPHPGPSIFPLHQIPFRTILIPPGMHSYYI